MVEKIKNFAMRPVLRCAAMLSGRIQQDPIRNQVNTVYCTQILLSNINLINPPLKTAYEWSRSDL